MAGGNDQDNKHNQKLQAVLLADSFQTTFRPITLDPSTPKILCPLNNITMIDYAIEYLAGAGVEELYIFCVSGGDAIESHIQQTRSTTSGATKSSTMMITCLRDSSVTDAGGALRELYNKNLIQSDPFILMSGDVVTNADIGPAMVEHKARHKKDNSAIMTVLLKRVGGWNVNVRNGSNRSHGNDGEGDTASSYSPEVSCHVSPLQSLSEDLTVALAPPPPQPSPPSSSSSSSQPPPPSTHSRLFLYDTNPNSTITHLPTSFFQSTQSIELYNNMIDTGLYICSPDVLAKFSDEWDYLDIKTFISNSVAEEEEGLQTKIYAKHLSSSEYASKIHDFRTYHATSSDLLKRWCYPIVPDNLPCGYEKKYRYAVERYMMYIEQKGKTKVGKQVTLKGPGMVGSHTKIDDGCHIAQSVIGNECFVGKNVSLHKCHLWDHVSVEDGASVTESILCNGCIVRKGAVIGKGCVVGKNCIIGENVVLPEFTRITNHVDEEDDMFSDDDDEEDSDRSSGEESYHDVIGKDGAGRVWKPTNNIDDDDDYDDEYYNDYDGDDDDNEESKEWNALEQMKSQSIGYDATPLLQKRMKRQLEADVLIDVDHDVDNEEDDDFNSNLAPSNLNEDGQLIYGRQADVDVVKELKLICLDYDFSSPIENLRIELNSFKFSQNATFSDCVSGAILAILERLELTDDISPMKLVASFKKELEAWEELLNKLCRGKEEEISIIKIVEKAATSGGAIGSVLSREPSFRFILQTLHSEDIVSDEAVLSWATIRREGNQDSPMGKLFNQKHTQEFLEWVEQDSSSSSGSDDDSDSDSDSSSD